MRSTIPLALALLGGTAIHACSSPSSKVPVQADSGESLTTGAGGTVNSTTGAQTSTVSGMTATTANGSVSNETSSASTTSAGTSSNGFGGGATSNMNGMSNSATTGSSVPCTDTPPDDRETCSTWAEWGECDADWLSEYCHLSCDRCPEGSDPTGSGGASSTTDSSSPTSSTDSNTTGSATSTTGSQLGDDNPWGDVNGGQQGWATRYWDCCKPSCGWGQGVRSCDANDNRVGDANAQSVCSGGGTFTCHSMAPWAYSNQVSFGFAAINGVNCGDCFHVQFTGTASRGSPLGADQLAGKSMIIMATNIGVIEQGQFDILIPGGGVGIHNGCSTQWGVSNEELGAQYGGFRSECGGEDLNQIKNCMRNKCESVFGSRGLTELYDGCMWYTEWFHAADNPDFRFEQIECPQELRDAAY